MPNLIYRAVATCGALGCGYPRESLQSALKGHVDAIVCDGGSMDAGPYYLGTGTPYFARDAVKADYRQMVAAGKRLGCPVIIGSSGMAGGNRNVDWMLDIAREVFAELDVRDAKVAVIRSELDTAAAECVGHRIETCRESAHFILRRAENPGIEIAS